MPPQDRYDLERRAAWNASATPAQDRSAIDILKDAQNRASRAGEDPTASEGSMADFRDLLGQNPSGFESDDTRERLLSTYPSGTQAAYRRELAERMGSEDLAHEIMRQDAEENAFQLWYRRRAMAEGLSLDPYDPLHMFDYKAYWRDALKKGTRPMPDGMLTKDFDWRTPEGEAEVIRRAKEAWGEDWSYDNPSKTSVRMKTGKSPKYMTIEELKTIQEHIDEFNEGKLKPGRKRFPLVKFKPGPPDPGGRPSYFETPILDEGVTSIQEQSEVEYAKLLNKGSQNKKGGAFKEIGRQVPDLRAKDIKPDPATNAAPPEVTEQLRGMDPEIMNKLQQNPQLRSIFGLE